MPSFTITKHIPHPVEAVFATASDFPNAAENVEGIVRVEMLTEGPVGLGTRFKETRIMFKREASETMEVTRWEPPRCYVLSADSHGCKYESTLTFESVDDGAGTQVSMTFDARPYKFMAKVMAVVFRPMFKSCMKLIEKDLDDIGKSISARERGDAAPPEATGAASAEA